MPTASSTTTVNRIPAIEGESLGEKDFERSPICSSIDRIRRCHRLEQTRLGERGAGQRSGSHPQRSIPEQRSPHTRSKVPLQRVLDTGLFDYDKAESSAGWIRELQGEHTPETEEYGISSFTYRQSRPFDARKFADAIAVRKNLQGVLRAKGFFWVAADHRVAYQFAQAGGILNINPVGLWWAAVDEDTIDIPEESRPDRQPDWHEHYGDRKQMLVFIGQNMDEAAIRGLLDDCLSGLSTRRGGLRGLGRRENPFPTLPHPDRATTESED